MAYVADMDWSLIQHFVAIAENGSLSAAARASNVSQPTLGRAVQALEAELSVALFERHSKGLALTAQGKDLFHYAKSMAVTAHQFALAADGHSDRLEGSVRITASQVMATFFLPAILSRLRRAEPRINVEVVATDAVENLLFREADIAIRMVRPEQQDLLTQHVGELKIGAYASHAYLADRGTPSSAEDLALHTLIGYDRSTLIVDSAKKMGLDLTRDDFAVRCDDQVVCWQMLLAGAGIGFAPVELAGRDERVVRVFSSLPFPSTPIWLTSHPILKTNPRVRYVVDFLAKALRDID